MFESHISAVATEIAVVGEASRNNSSMVVRHGRTCSKMRSTILRAGKQEGGAVEQSFEVLAWMTINSSRKNLNQLDYYHRFAHKLY